LTFTKFGKKLSKHHELEPNKTSINFVKVLLIKYFYLIPGILKKYFYQDFNYLPIKSCKMVLLFTIIKALVALVVVAVIAAVAAPAISTYKTTAKAREALDNYKKKIRSILNSGEATNNDCAELKRLEADALAAGNEQSAIDREKFQIGHMCP
jgi:competence protein ComGC